MRHYIHSIPISPCDRPCPLSLQQTAVLDALNQQSQLLMELLGATNALTAALLAERQKQPPVSGIALPLA